jgi:hypothetical protein
MADVTASVQEKISLTRGQTNELDKVKAIGRWVRKQQRKKQRIPPLSQSPVFIYFILFWALNPRYCNFDNDKPTIAWSYL